MDNNRNFLIAMALSVAILVGWQFLYINPKLETQQQAEQAELERQGAEQPSAPAPGDTSGSDVPTSSADAPAADGSVPGQAAAPAPQGNQPLTREQTLAGGQRLKIDTPSLFGSINLRGGRFDDLRLKDYHQTVDDSSPTIVLLSPSEAPNGYFAEFGFSGNAEELPGPNTVWTVPGGAQLTQETPVTLTYTNSAGLTFSRTISVDEKFLFTIDDRIENTSGQNVALQSYGRVTRYSKPTGPSVFVIHEGLIGVLGENGLEEVDYGDVEDDGAIGGEEVDSGWLGITDKYWAAALIPDQGRRFTPRFAYFDDGRARYQSDFLSSPLNIQAGQSAEVQTMLFAGAKVTEVIDGYQEERSIPQFDLLIDWGWFYFITKPLFWVIDHLSKLFGNFGVAILLTTVLVKAVFFPLANKSYASMAKMKMVQPKMMEIREKHKDDRVKQQQAMMALYKTEKINPVAGCWPVLVQIPVFFALYKVIYVTIEMRHAPFFGWIQDLSAPDPTSLFNLFGLIPLDLPQFLMIGVWPLIMGITMFLQMRMNPTPPDPTQAMIFTWMPIVFTFMLASFPAGLVIYWAWNNTLSIIQQGLIMRRHGAKIELWDNLIGLFRKKPKPVE